MEWMEWLAHLLQVFFEESELDPTSVGEIEIIPSLLPWGEWYLHIQPEQPWFAEVNCHDGQWGVTLHNYL